MANSAPPAPRRPRAAAEKVAEHVCAMSGVVGGSSCYEPPGSGFSQGLGFLSELKRDISSYLTTGRGPERAASLANYSSVLCYSRPADADQDRWREARQVGGLFGTGLERGVETGALGTGTSSSSSRPPRPQAPPCCFGAPPRSSSIRWPGRPTEEDLAEIFAAADDAEKGAALGAANAAGAGGGSGSGRAVGSRRSSGGGGGGGDSDDSGESADSGTSDALGGRLGSRLRVPGAKSAAERGSPSPGPRGGAGIVAAASIDARELLEFSSCFESSNLQHAVYNKEDASYDLVLENDVHTRGHTQWFYFAVRNGRPGQTVRMRIVNMSKAKSLYRVGMRPLAWSETRAAEEAAHAALAGGEVAAPFSRLWAGQASRLWEPVGENVRYHQTAPREELRGFAFHGYTLAFDFTFSQGRAGSSRGDIVFFAMCMPFTYSMLQLSLRALAQDPSAGPLCKFRCLCGTLGDVRCDLLEISNWAISKVHKKAVVISARVHPGESNASWIVHGLIGFLLSGGPEAQVLRDRFIWQIVPMLNPDGVVCGNYRCGLCGVDLNRQWRRPSEALHGTVYMLKRLVARAKRKLGLCLYIDLHGHSRKLGLFTYACGQFAENDYRRFTVRMYPKLLSLLTPEFELSNCRWRIGKGKRGTGRVVVAKDLGLTETYTIEASFFGAAIVKEAADAAKEADALPTQAAPGTCGDAPQEADMTIADSDITLFTAEKLEGFGANIARALLLHHNLNGTVHRCIQAALRKGAPFKASCKPWPQVSIAVGPAGIPPEPSPSGSRSSSPSVAESTSDQDYEIKPEASEASMSSPSPVRMHGRSGEGCSSPEVADEDGGSGGDGGDGGAEQEAEGVEPCASEDQDEEEEEDDAAAALSANEAEAEEAGVKVEALLAEGADGGLEPQYLGINTDEVMLQLRGTPVEDPEREEEEESAGSDSAPSEDNLAQEELSRLGRALKSRRKAIGRKRGAVVTVIGVSRTSASTGPKEKRSGGKGGGSRGKRGQGGGAQSRRRAAPSASRSGDKQQSRSGLAVDGKVVERTPSKPDLHKVVAFGQTTYFNPKGAAAAGTEGPPSSSAARSSGGQGARSSPQPPARSAFGGGQGSSEDLVVVAGAGASPAIVASGGGFAVGGGSTSSSSRPAQPWPPITQQAPKEAFVFLGPPKDRFAFAGGGSGGSGAISVGRSAGGCSPSSTGAVSGALSVGATVGARTGTSASPTPPPSLGGDGDEPSAFGMGGSGARRGFYMRNTSSSFLQLHRSRGGETPAGLMSHMPIGTSGCGVGGSSGSGAIVGGIANGDPPQGSSGSLGVGSGSGQSAIGAIAGSSGRGGLDLGQQHWGSSKRSRELAWDTGRPATSGGTTNPAAQPHVPPALGAGGTGVGLASLNAGSPPWRASTVPLSSQKQPHSGELSVPPLAPVSAPPVGCGGHQAWPPQAVTGSPRLGHCPLSARGAVAAADGVPSLRPSSSSVTSGAGRGIAASPPASGALPMSPATHPSSDGLGAELPNAGGGIRRWSSSALPQAVVSKDVFVGAAEDSLRQEVLLCSKRR